MKIERYELHLSFDNDVGFVGAQIRLILRGGVSSREMDYRSLQSILHTKGGFLVLWTNGRQERISVLQSDPFYGVLLKIQSDILEAIKNHFLKDF